MPRRARLRQGNPRWHCTLHLRSNPGLPVEAKKRCDDMWDALCAYCDGETSEDEARRVAAHLRECRECRSAAHLLRRTAHILRNEDPVEVPPDLRERILAATVLKPQSRRRWMLQWWLPGARLAPARIAAVAGLAALIGILLAPRNVAPAFKVFGGAIQPETPAASTQVAAGQASPPAPLAVRYTPSPAHRPPVRRIAFAPVKPGRPSPHPALSAPAFPLKQTPRMHTPRFPPERIPSPVQVASSATMPDQSLPDASPEVPSAAQAQPAPADPAPPAAVGPPSAPAEVHIQLAAGDTVNAQAYASLAGLKRTVQSHKDTAWTLADGDAEDRRVLTVDLYRSRF